MANTFSNNKKVKMIAAAVADSMDYVKKSRSYLSEADLKNKKFGKSYKVYIPDPGKVSDGTSLECDPTDIEEVEMEITLQERNTAVELDSWDELTNVEDFKNEIAMPKALKLAKTVQKDVIDSTVFDASQVSIASAADLSILAKGSAKLDEVGVAGKKVSFMAPTLNAEVAAKALGQFIPDSIQKDIYGSNYLGEYAGASQVSLAGLPTVKASSATTLGITLTSAFADKDGNVIGYAPVSEGTCDSACNVGDVFSFTGLKIVGVDGITTDQTYDVVVKEVNGTTAKFAPIRIAVGDNQIGNPNAVIATTAASVSGTAALNAGSDYMVGVVRQEDALAFDAYKFSDIPGSENETETVDGVTVQMAKFGDGKSRKTLVRLDLPFAAGIPDARNQSLIYIKK